MNNYELTLILDSKITAAKKKSFLESLEKMTKVLEGKVEKAEDWGVKELFHEIKKKKEGLYLFVPVSLPPKSAKQLDQKLRMDENVLRHLLVKTN